MIAYKHALTEGFLANFEEYVSAHRAMDRKQMIGNFLAKLEEQAVAAKQAKTPPTFRDSTTAFENAIAKGKLARDSRSSDYAGLYMYMHSPDSVDYFKNIATRKYITVQY